MGSLSALVANSKSKQKMNPDYIINSVKQISDIHFRSGETSDRLAYRVGMLEQKIREICTMMQIQSEDHKAEVTALKKQIDNLT